MSLVNTSILGSYAEPANSRALEYGSWQLLLSSGQPLRAAIAIRSIQYILIDIHHDWYIKMMAMVLSKSIPRPSRHSIWLQKQWLTYTEILSMAQAHIWHIRIRLQRLKDCICRL